MSPEHRAFLKAICAHPEDDLPRLVFADYLEESGEPALIARAEFIRTQIELHNGKLDRAEYLRLADKANALRREFLDELDQFLLEHPHIVVRAMLFKGFPFWMMLDLHTFLKLGQTILPKFVPIQSVHITKYSPSLEPQPIPPLEEMKFMLITSLYPSYPNLVSASLLEIPRRLASRVMESFLRKTEMPQLTHLKIQAEELLMSDLMSLLSLIEANTSLASLRELDLSEHPWEDNAGYYLSSARALERLSKLRLTGHRFSSETQALLQRRFGDRIIL